MVMSGCTYLMTTFLFAFLAGNVECSQQSDLAR
jgi:hypothetical protein